MLKVSTIPCGWNSRKSRDFLPKQSQNQMSSGYKQLSTDLFFRINVFHRHLSTQDY